MSQIVFLLLLIAMFMLGIPVMVSLGLTSVVMMFAKGGVKLATIIQQMIGGLNTFTLLAAFTPNSGQSSLYRKSDYPEYFRESQQQRHFLAKYSG